MIFKTAKDFDNRPNPSHYDTPAAPIIFFISTIVFGFPALVNLLYIWNWIGAFSPESRLIARLIGALTGTTNG